MFWIVDNGSSHRGQASINRLHRRWPDLILVRTPHHAKPGRDLLLDRPAQGNHPYHNIRSLASVAGRLTTASGYSEITEPFGWRFTRNDLSDWLKRLPDRRTTRLTLVA